MGFSDEMAEEAVRRFGDDLHAGCHWLMMRDDLGRVPKRLKVERESENTYIGSKIRYLSVNWTVDKFDKKHALIRLRRDDGRPSRWEHISDARIEWTSLKHESVQSGIPRAVWKRKIGSVKVSLAMIEPFGSVTADNALKKYIKEGRPGGNGSEWAIWRAVVQLTHEFPHTPSRPRPRGVFSEGIHSFRVELMTYLLALCEVYHQDQDEFSRLLYNDSMSNILKLFPEHVRECLKEHIQLWLNPQPHMHKEMAAWRKDCLPLICFEFSSLCQQSKSVTFDVLIHDMTFVRPVNYEPGVHMQIQRVLFNIYEKMRPSGTCILGPMDSSFLRLSLTASRKNANLVDQPQHFSTQLFPYQRRCLGWLLNREKNGPSCSSFGWHRHQLEDGFSFYASEFGHLGHSPPNDNIRGGLLCQDVGMGKTVEMLALLSANHLNDPTLVVLPTTMLSVWQTEAAKHVPTLKLIKFHGPRRTRNMDDLRGADIVLTTYRVVVTETSNHVPTLGSIRWGRIILDESHEMRGYNSATARAMCRLYSPLRWCVSATPWPKGMTSVMAMLAFLGIPPFDEAATLGPFSAAHLIIRNQIWNPTIMRNLLKSVTWWQRKRHVQMNLPKVQHQYIDVENSSQDLYKFLLLSIRTRMMSDELDPTVNARTRILHYTRWVRHAATHISLNRITQFGIPIHSSDQPSSVSSIETFVQTLGTRNYDQSVRDVIESWRNGNETCTICMGAIERPTLTPCNHMYCYECIQSSYAHDQQRKCPLCRTPAGSTPLNELTLGEVTQEEGPSFRIITDVQGRNIQLENDVYQSYQEAIQRSSNKFNWLVENIKKNEEKFIVFTEFHVTWKKLCEIFVTHKIPFASIEGRMTPKQRHDAIEHFQNDPNVRVFVMTTRTASVGITLTSGSHIVFLEPNVNEQVKKQAIGRAWRIGQNRPITVTTLRTKDTLDMLTPNQVMAHLKG